MSARHLRLVPPIEKPGVPCVEFSLFEWRGVIIWPDHPQYAELYALNEAAADRNALWGFELYALRSPLETVWAWLRGVP